MVATQNEREGTLAGDGRQDLSQCVFGSGKVGGIDSYIAQVSQTGVIRPGQGVPGEHVHHGADALYAINEVHTGFPYTSGTQTDSLTGAGGSIMRNAENSHVTGLQLTDSFLLRPSKGVNSCVRDLSAALKHIPAPNSDGLGVSPGDLTSPRQR